MNKQTPLVPDQKRIEAWTRALEAGGLSPEMTAEAYAKRGDAHRLRGEVDAAIDDFNRAIEIDAQYGWA